MLIIPLENKISWRNPPVITLLVIALNCFVFFFLQADDGHRYQQAYQYYFDSGLAAIELPRYAAHIAAESGEAPPEPGSLEKPSKRAFALLLKMRRDSEFMDRLYGEAVIAPGSPVHAEWSRKRAAFDSRMDRVVGHGYALVPAEVEPWMFFTMMFLHGGLWHLLGNMIFLWIVGCVLEIGLGRTGYSLIYILGGLSAAGLYYLVHHNSYVPAIGASGAISGLMGALTILYGTTRIRVFFSTGFYFDYFRMPAMLLLPFWLGKELLSFFLGAAGGIAYMAHAGGLLGGALLGMGGRRLLNESGKSFFEEPPEDPAPSMIEAALQRLAQLDFDGARQKLHSVLAAQPDHAEALGHLFNLDKQRPDTARFHDTARQYLSLLVGGQANIQKTLKVYREYAKLADRPGLPLDLSAKLAAAFLDAGHISEGRKILAELIRRRPDLEAVPALLLRLANALEREGMPARAKKYRQILRRRYPHSQEARMAEQRRR